LIKKINSILEQNLQVQISHVLDESIQNAVNLGNLIMMQEEFIV